MSARYNAPQACLRKDIASKIFPASTATISVARLNRWIHSDPILLSCLIKAGYRKGSQWFTPKVIRVLERFFL